MSRVNVFFATGYEEVEALTVVDLLRRAGIETDMVSVTGEKQVTSSHGVTVMMDKLFEELDGEADMLVLPGGIPGTPNLKGHAGLCELLKRYNEDGKYIAAICAAPTVFGDLGLLEGKNAVCYPGMEAELTGAKTSEEAVVVDGNIITSRGLGTAIDFGLKLVEILTDEVTSGKLASKIVYQAMQK